MRVYSLGVMRFASILGACSIVLCSCSEKNEVVVTETRALSTRDKSPLLNATSDQRFRDAKPSPVMGETPLGWLEVPPSQFRQLNYRFGESGLGEAWVSIASGSVLDNINRWLGQFETAKLTPQNLADMRKVSVAGFEGVWVEAEGTYASGMGAGPKPGYALAGVVCDIGGRILTVKMVGPKAEVMAASSTLETFAKNLKIVDQATR
ncbi:MAG: hypothetical protein RLZ22_428 [Verrucomicrobiota bacterium]|jgi:hypothetical protein